MVNTRKRYKSKIVRRKMHMKDKKKKVKIERHGRFERISERKDRFFWTEIDWIMIRKRIAGFVLTNFYCSIVWSIFQKVKHVRKKKKRDFSKVEWKCVLG